MFHAVSKPGDQLTPGWVCWLHLLITICLISPPTFIIITARGGGKRSRIGRLGVIIYIFIQGVHTILWREYHHNIHHV